MIWKPPLKHKYGAKPCTYDDKKFPSKLERDCYILLKDMEKKGEIRFFLRQIGIDLPGGARHFVDFQVFTKEHVLFIEAKGRDLPQGKGKRKASEDLYNISIHVVKKAIEIPIIVKLHS